MTFELFLDLRLREFFLLRTKRHIIDKFNDNEAFPYLLTFQTKSDGKQRY